MQSVPEKHPRKIACRALLMKLKNSNYGSIFELSTDTAMWQRRNVISDKIAQ
jgi:hypothetical protein